MIQFIVAWFLILTIFAIFHYHAMKNTKGILTIEILAIWMVIIAPTFSETNTLTFFQNVLQPNIVSISISFVCLLIAGVSLGLFFESSFENNTTTQYIFVTTASIAIIFYVLFVLLLVPVNIDQCSCLYGYYGETCENSCWAENGAICSGHGTCQINGCQCDSFFQGQTCNACINQYNLSLIHI